MIDEQTDRREFLASACWLPLLSVANLAAGNDVSPMAADPARQLLPTTADLGTNFAAVERLAKRSDDAEPLTSCLVRAQCQKPLDLRLQVHLAAPA